MIFVLNWILLSYFHFHEWCHFSSSSESENPGGFHHPKVKLILLLKLSVESSYAPSPCLWKLRISSLQCRSSLVLYFLLSPKPTLHVLVNISLWLIFFLITYSRLTGRANSLEKILMLGKIKGKGEEGNRGWDGWMASLTQWTGVWENSRR